MSAEQPMKAAVSVAEMARMCSISRARFYQLMKAGTFPPPEYDAETGRPFYPEDKQRACLEVRRHNCGIDGRPVLFYARRQVQATTGRKRPARAATTKAEPHTEIVDAVRALGLTWATAAQVRAAVAELYPEGATDQDKGELIRAVFLHLKRQNSADNVRR